MSNGISGFYQTVVAAAEEACQALVYNLQAIESIYWDYKPEQQALGQTINVPIPAIRTGGVVDAGTSDMTLVDATANTTPIVFNRHPQDALVIRNFEQYNSPVVLRNLFLDSALKGIKEYINADICSLFTTANFPTNGVISTTGGVITTTQFLAAQAALSDARVPVLDMPNMSLILPSVPYTKMIDPATSAGLAWTEALIAGERTAETVRATGKMPTSFGCNMKLDQQLPVTGSVGSRTWSPIYMHKYAVAGVTRPLPPPDGRIVDFTYVDFGGIPILVSLGYNQYPKQGWILSVEAGYGRQVIRDGMGQLFSTAE